MSLSHSPKIVTDGLVLYLDAANKKSYPGTGTLWKDIININNTVLNGCTYEQTNLGGIVMSSGAQYLTIPIDNFNFMGTGDFSIETIVRSDDLTNPRSRHPLQVFHTVTADNTPGWSCGHTSSATSMEIMCSDGINRSRVVIPEGSTIENAKYYHRVFTVSRTSGVRTKYYRDSKLIGEANATSVTGSLYNPISDYGGPGITFGFVWGWRFQGGINIIKIYNKVLNELEIKQNFEALRGRYNI